VAEVRAPSDAAPVAAQSAGMPQVGAYVLPTDELAGIAQQSGLTWVNSDAEKIAAVQAVIAAEPKPVHVPRERLPVIALDDRPLVLVETKLDLRNIKLPFEETQSA
jgi:ribonuclease E